MLVNLFEGTSVFIISQIPQFWRYGMTHVCFLVTTITRRRSEAISDCLLISTNAMFSKDIAFVEIVTTSKILETLFA